MIDLASSNKLIWVTEIGKPSGAENFNEADQAKHLTDNIPPLIQKVDKAFWYELIDDQNTDPPKENYFGLIHIECTRKPAYAEFKGMIEALPQ